jgi:hypothetical protein
MPSSPSSSPVNVPLESLLVDTSLNAPTPPSSSPEYIANYVVTNQQYIDVSGNVYTETQFITTDLESDVQITEDLCGNVIKYYDDTQDSDKTAIIARIQLYADEIQCKSFQGKGSIDDYAQLFQAAAQIANESAQMQLDVDVDGFNEFANAADDLSVLFTSFILKLQNVSIIDDSAFLNAVANALGKIANLSKVFARFKETILATSTVQLPKSAHDTSLLIQNVSSQIDCAMKYINHFVDSSVPAPETANLSTEEQGIITAAVATIHNWNILCDQGVRIAMASDPDIQSIHTINQKLKQSTQTLANATSQLKAKLNVFHMKSM